MKSPPLHHREPLRVPEVRPQPPRPVAGGYETRIRIRLELQSPPGPARGFRIRVRIRTRSRSLSDLALGAPVTSRAPPLAAMDLEVAVEAVGDDGVKRLELARSGLGELLHV